MNDYHTTHVAVQKGWYDKYYKLMLVPPVILVLLSLIYLGVFYANTGDFIIRDSSLAGGTTITLQGNYDATLLENSLQASFDDVRIRTVNDIASGKRIATIIDSSAAPEELRVEVEKTLGIKLTSENSSIEFTGPSLSSNFYRQLIIAIIVSFILMSIVIFFLFRTFVPSLAVIFAAFSD